MIPKNLEYPTNREALADQFILVLNELVGVDRKALETLIEFRVPCDEFLADHPTVQVSVSGEGEAKSCQVGLLGILNGLVGVQEDGWGYITAVFDDGHRLEKFVRTSPPTYAR